MITYIVDIEQIILPVQPLINGFSYPVWPTKWWIDLIHWYAANFDPLLLARPGEWLEWIPGCLQGGHHAGRGELFPFFACEGGIISLFRVRGGNYFPFSRAVRTLVTTFSQIIRPPSLPSLVPRHDLD